MTPSSDPILRFQTELLRFQTELDMGIKYLPRWSSEANDLHFNRLYAVSFSMDGQWLGCCDTPYTYILSADSGNLCARIEYPKKAVGILWTGDILICAFEDGAVASVLAVRAKVRLEQLLST